MTTEKYPSTFKIWKKSHLLTGIITTRIPQKILQCKDFMRWPLFAAQGVWYRRWPAGEIVQPIQTKEGAYPIFFILNIVDNSCPQITDKGIRILWAQLEICIPGFTFPKIFLIKTIIFKTKMEKNSPCSCSVFIFCIDQCSEKRGDAGDQQLYRYASLKFASERVSLFFSSISRLPAEKATPNWKLPLKRF